MASGRDDRILRLLGEGVTEAEALALALHVSVSTVRRDLARLAGAGRLLRTFGGAAAIGGVAPERSLRQRSGEFVAEKAAIAVAALDLVRPGFRVIMDAGTTTGALARLLPRRAPLRVITNGLAAMETLAGEDEIELVSVGGEFRKLSGSFVGPHAEAAMARMTADIVFLGADGIVAGRGICEATDGQASLKSLMVRQAERVAVLVTADKLGRSASHCWSALDRPWTLITDASATARQLAAFRTRPEIVISIA